VCLLYIAIALAAQRGDKMRLPNCPSNRPPDFIPDETAGVHRDDVHTIKNVELHMIYIWMNNSHRFWMYPVQFDVKYMYGYVWDGKKWANVRMNRKYVKTYY